MRLSRSSKLGSLAAIALMSVTSVGCLVIDDDRRGGPDHGRWDEQPPPDTTPLEPAEVDIDADRVLDATAGEGIGVMVEYATGGHWRVYTTCDYSQPENPGVSCDFDIFATVLDQDGAISNPKGQDLEGKDTIELQADGTVHLFTQNTLGFGGITFDTAPGAMLKLDVYLDGVQDPHFIYWVGKNVLHRGAPTVPVHFVPSEPPVVPDPVEPPAEEPQPGGDTPKP